MKFVGRFWFLAASMGLASCGGAEPAGDKPLTIEEKGRAAFTACAICHSVKDPAAPGYVQLVGPSLLGVYGAPSARLEGYGYSKAMRAANLVWDDATLNAFIDNPHQVVPKTRMSFAGEHDADKRAAIIAYLKTLK